MGRLPRNLPEVFVHGAPEPECFGIITALGIEGLQNRTGFFQRSFRVGLLALVCRQPQLLYCVSSCGRIIKIACSSVFA